MLGPEPTSEREVLRRAVATVRERIPSSWRVEEQYDLQSLNTRPIDAALELTAPDGGVARLIFEAKRIVERRDIGRIVSQLTRTLSSGDVPVLAAKYLTPQVRADLQAGGVSFVDATGNLSIVAQTPAIFLADRGEDRDPWRGKGRPRGTLRGEPAARVVRALLDFDREWRVRDLIDVSRASTGATYRVLEYLQQEGLAERGADSAIRVPDWQRLLKAWADDAPFLSVNRTSSYIEPRGPESLLERLRANGATRYAVTGTAAAREWAPYAPTKAVYVYVTSIEDAGTAWNLRPTTTAPNVVLVEPPKSDDVAFDRARESRMGYRIAAPTQVAVDLMNGPGRNPAEAEELLAWMSANEGAWRG